MLALEYFDAYKPVGEGFITSTGMYTECSGYTWLKNKKGKVEKLSQAKFLVIMPFKQKKMGDHGFVSSHKFRKCK